MHAQHDMDMSMCHVYSACPGVVLYQSPLESPALKQVACTRLTCGDGCVGGRLGEVKQSQRRCLHKTARPTPLSLQRPPASSAMPIPTDNSAASEHDSQSDSDWLDIASTDKDSDDNDSIYSSRETDHEDLSRSRSRRSSLSYGSSRDGDVDAWEGLIDDSADEGTGRHSDVLAPSPHVPSLSQHPAEFDLNPAQETTPEELRVNEGLDQSMISTLSSSRSSSLHTSTVHNSSRDIRLSFPDPITSSCRELLSTSYEEIQRDSDILSSPIDSDALSDGQEVDDEELLSASQMLSTQTQATSAPSVSGPELKVFLYGFSTISKWSIVNGLLQKVTHGAGLTITPNLDKLQGSVRQLTVSGSFEHDRAFPRIITVLDRTLHPHDTADDVGFECFSMVN